MIKSSMGGQGRNRGKSTRKLKGETIRRERQLRTDRSHLIKIRNCLFEEDGADKDTLAPFHALTSLKKNNLVANIEFTTGAYLDKLDISTLKRIRKHAAPRASFFGTSCFGVEDARFLIVRGIKQEEEEKQEQEPVVSPPSQQSQDDHDDDDAENVDPDGPLREDEVGEFTEQEMKEIEETLKEMNVNVDNDENSDAHEEGDDEDDEDEDEDEEDEPDYPVIAYVRFFYTLQGELIDRNWGQPCLMIQDLFVEPAFQHCGLGKHLVQLCELMCRSLTLPMLYIVSTKSMEANLRGFLENKLTGYVDDDGSDFLDRPMSVMLPHLIAFVKRF